MKFLIILSCNNLFISQICYFLYAFQNMRLIRLIRFIENVDYIYRIMM